jgi:hypothetical protein
LRLSYRRLAKRAALTALEERFADLLALGVRVRFQDHRQRGRKVYALHAPEVECIGKGKARAPYEFGYKVSVATPATKPKGGQFVLHAKALHGNPFDGHTLEPVIAELEALTGELGLFPRPFDQLGGEIAMPRGGHGGRTACAAPVDPADGGALHPTTGTSAR